MSAHAEGAPTTTRPPDPRADPRSAERVLAVEPCAIVVDDDADIREALTDALESEGYRVARAANGREALSLMTAFRGCVVVLDLMMPVMSGWQVLEAMRADPNLRAVAVVVMTASHDAPPDVSVVRKPFSISDLVATMRRAAERRDAGGDGPADGQTIH
jgi:CheY-like chemotaxis protein